MRQYEKVQRQNETRWDKTKRDAIWWDKTNEENRQTEIRRGDTRWDKKINERGKQETKQYDTRISKRRLNEKKRQKWYRMKQGDKSWDKIKYRWDKLRKKT